MILRFGIGEEAHRPVDGCARPETRAWSFGLEGERSASLSQQAHPRRDLSRSRRCFRPWWRPST